MALRMNNVQLSPRGRTTSIVSLDGKNWFTEDGKPVKDIYEDSAAGDFLAIVFLVALLYFVFRLLV